MTTRRSRPPDVEDPPVPFRGRPGHRRCRRRRRPAGCASGRPTGCSRSAARSPARWHPNTRDWCPVTSSWPRKTRELAGSAAGGGMGGRADGGAATSASRHEKQAVEGARILARELLNGAQLEPRTRGIVDPVHGRLSRAGRPPALRAVLRDPGRARGRQPDEPRGFFRRLFHRFRRDHRRRRTGASPRHAAAGHARGWAGRLRAQDDALGRGEHRRAASCCGTCGSRTPPACTIPTTWPEPRRRRSCAASTGPRPRETPEAGWRSTRSLIVAARRRSSSLIPGPEPRRPTTSRSGWSGTTSRSAARAWAERRRLAQRGPARR